MCVCVCFIASKVTMKLRGSDPLEADIEDADLAIVNANRKSVQESVQRIIFESDGDLITVAQHERKGLTFVFLEQTR